MSADLVKELEQQRLQFPPRSPCFGPESSPEQWKYSGFKRDFTVHKWCAKHYVGLGLPDGTIQECECECHHNLNDEGRK